MSLCQLCDGANRATRHIAALSARRQCPPPLPSSETAHVPSQLDCSIGGSLLIAKATIVYY
jgi:hypothetical protein